MLGTHRLVAWGAMMTIDSAEGILEFFYDDLVINQFFGSMTSSCGFRHTLATRGTYEKVSHDGCDLQQFSWRLFADKTSSWRVFACFVLWPLVQLRQPY